MRNERERYPGMVVYGQKQYMKERMENEQVNKQ